MNYKIVFLPLLFASLCFFACKNEPKTPAVDVSQLTDVEEFNTFFQRFHEDSLYQIEHITFPLQGLPSGADSTARADNNFVWEKETWRMHRHMPPNSGYTREYEILTPTLINEYTADSDKSYGLVRRFAKLDNDWYLIYYAGVNRLK